MSAVVSEPAVFRSHMELFRAADLIFVDGPKDGSGTGLVDWTEPSGTLPDRAAGGAGKPAI
ncbi:MAG: hypothetical protein ACREJV_11720 [Candidatus Rokuibacteriota bacterium]